MDGSRFDAWTRRRIGIALPSALAAVWSWTQGGTARTKKKKKKCKPQNCPLSPDLCPVRGCCECKESGGSSSVFCALLAETTEQELIDACEDACQAEGTQILGVVLVQENTTNFCATNNQCARVACPVPL